MIREQRIERLRKLGVLSKDHPVSPRFPGVPAWETLPNEKIPPSPDVVGERYQVLSRMITDEEPLIIISNLHACLQRLIDPNQFLDRYLCLRKGEAFSFDRLIERLTVMGYQRCPVAADKGEFAVRGGIIDVFPVSSADPYRIEFWGDEVESIRLYDPIGQKTIKPIENIDIPPAQEMELIEKNPNLSTILDYLDNNAVIIFE